MHNFCEAICVGMVGTILATGSAFAQDHHDDHHDNHSNGGYVQHKDWHKGGRINHDDWNRGQQVDWHTHHLQSPPRGYEWRQVDGNYVLAAAATGIIAATIIASTR